MTEKLVGKEYQISKNKTLLIIVKEIKSPPDVLVVFLTASEV